MTERELIKQAIENNIISKENIRRMALNSVSSKINLKGVFSVKRKLLATVFSAVIICVLSISVYAAFDIYEYNQANSFLGELGIKTGSMQRSDAKRIWKDIKSEKFEQQATIDILDARAEEIGIVFNEPAKGEDIYKAILEYNNLVYTAKITSAQLRGIKAGLSYKEIVKSLGVTKDIGKDKHILQYAVDGDKVFYLSFADENDICAQSGENLLKTLEDAKQDNTDENTFNAKFNQRGGNSILVDCPTYKDFDIIYVAITEDTVIEYANGNKASIDDIEGDLIITITGEIRESYPPQATAVKIVIK